MIFKPKGKPIEKFISQLFSSGLHMPAGALLAACFLAYLVVGAPILIGVPAVLLAIYVVVSAVPD